MYIEWDLAARRAYFTLSLHRSFGFDLYHIKKDKQATSLCTNNTTFKLKSRSDDLMLSHQTDVIFYIKKFIKKLYCRFYLNKIIHLYLQKYIGMLEYSRYKCCAMIPCEAQFHNFLFNLDAPKKDNPNYRSNLE